MSTSAPRNAPVDGPDPAQQRRPPYDRRGDAQEHYVGPPASGIYGAYAEGLDDPDEPPSTPQSMKLPILMRAMLTPASLAPSGLPPVA